MAIYNLFILLYSGVIRLISPFNEKAREWVSGRKKFFQNNAAIAKELRGCVWIHCASLGEFEQGRTLIEKIRREQPDKKILLTFFSPSGYRERKNYAAADLVTYLPLDTSKNAKRFLDLFQPSVVIFIKYEFWHHFLRECGLRGIPLYLASAMFRKDQYFFKSWGRGFQKTLKAFTWFFVQDENSREMLKDHGFENCTVAGDTRIDRVLELPQTQYSDPVIEKFLKGKKAAICGSVWPADTRLLQSFWNEDNDIRKWIIVPHDPTPSQIQYIRDRLKSKSAVWSEEDQSTGDEKFLIIDTVGILGKIYRYGWVAYVGGGFGKGVHNILEPAAYGLPVAFGPNHKKFPEAENLLTRGAAVCMHNSLELRWMISLLQNPAQSSELHNLILNYLNWEKGGTKIVYDRIFPTDIEI